MVVVVNHEERGIASSSLEQFLSNGGAECLSPLHCLCRELGQAVTSENARGMNWSNEGQISLH